MIYFHYTLQKIQVFKPTDTCLGHHEGKSIYARMTTNYDTDEETECGYCEDDAEQAQEPNVCPPRSCG